MANPENLIPNSQRTPEELREITRKGGIASGKARREKKTLKQIGDMIGSLDIKSPKNRAILKDAGIEDEDMINDVGMLFRLNLKAQSGDAKSIELLAKLRGQLKEQVSAEIVDYKPIVDLTKLRQKNGSENETINN